MSESRSGEEALLREWSADLAATESWLRTLAVGQLSYAACMRAERRANAIAAGILGRLGPALDGSDFRYPTHEETDELLHVALRGTDTLRAIPVEAVLRAVPAGAPDREAAPDLEPEPITEIPEYEPEPAVRLSDDEPDTELLEPPPPIPAAPPAATPSWITYDEPEEQPSYIEYEDDGKTDEVPWQDAPDARADRSDDPGQAEEPTGPLAPAPTAGQTAQAAAATPSEWDSLVSFEDEDEPTNPGVAKPPERAMSLRELAPTIIMDDDDPIDLVESDAILDEDEALAEEASPDDQPSYLTFDTAPSEDNEITGVFDGRNRLGAPPSLGQPDFADTDALVTLDEPIAIQSDLDGVEEEPPVPQPSIGGDSSTAPVVRVPPRLPPSPRSVSANDAFDLVAESELEDDGELGDAGELEDDLPSGPAPLAAADDPDAVDFGDDIVVDEEERPAPIVAPAPRTAPPRPVAAAVVAPARAGAIPPTPLGARVTAGLYGGAAVPTIRDTHDPRPKAAAIQLNAQQGTSRVLGLEDEEEPLEIGSAEDYGEEEPDYDPATGFGVAIREYEDDEPEPEPAPEEEETQPELPPAPVNVGPTAGEVAELLRKAKTADEAGQLDEGIALYSDVIDADPDHMEARVGRGRLFLDRGDFARSMSDFMVAEEVAPNHPEPQIAIGDLHFARKDFRKAIDYFDLALSMDKRSSKAYCRRGISHYYRKNYPQALKDLTEAQKLDANTPNITTYISMVKKKMK